MIPSILPICPKSTIQIVFLFGLLQKCKNKLDEMRFCMILWFSLFKPDAPFYDWLTLSHVFSDLCWSNSMESAGERNAAHQAVRATHIPTGFSVQCTSSQSQFVPLLYLKHLDLTTQWRKVEIDDTQWFSLGSMHLKILSSPCVDSHLGWGEPLRRKGFKIHLMLTMGFAPSSCAPSRSL